jgi:hypothetical protein
MRDYKLVHDPILRVLVYQSERKLVLFARQKESIWRKFKRERTHENKIDYKNISIFYFRAFDEHIANLEKVIELECTK